MLCQECSRKKVVPQKWKQHYLLSRAFFADLNLTDLCDCVTVGMEACYTHPHRHILITFSIGSTFQKGVYKDNLPISHCDGNYSSWGKQNLLDIQLACTVPIHKNHPLISHPSCTYPAFDAGNGLTLYSSTHTKPIQSILVQPQIRV